MSVDNQNIHGADDMLQKLTALKLYIKEDIPEVIGTEAVRHFKKAFADEGFTDKSLQKWASRKTRTHLQKKILTGQGGGDHLGDSIDYKVEGQTITVYSDKLYAQIHNEGGTIDVTPKMKAFFWAKHFEAKDQGDTELAEQYKFMALAKKITIVQRQFMGESTVMIETITAKIIRDLNRILNS